MTTLKIKPFKNRQTGNVAEMVIDGCNICVYYEEKCATGVVKAAIDNEELYWADWVPEGEAWTGDYVAGHCCLDDALSELETIMKAELISMPWHSETTGL